MVVGRVEAWRLADRAGDVTDDTAGPAHDMVVVVPDAALETGRAAGRLEAAYESGRGERVERVIDGLKRDMAYAIAHSGGDRLDAKVVAVPDGVEQGDAGGRHSQTGTA